jgi:nucleotide-binding universal stress UspA family protein
MKILVPVDGSKHSMEGLKVAAHYAKTKGAEVSVMTVISYIADIDLELSASERDRILESMKNRGEEILQKAKEITSAAGVANINTVLVTGTSAAHEIVSFAEKEKTDLIIIGSRGIGATQRFLLGSVAGKVVRYSPCCVYVVKEPCSCFI